MTLFSVKELASACEMTVEWILQEKVHDKKILLVPVMDGGLMYFSAIAQVLRRRGVEFDYQSVYVSGYMADGIMADDPQILKPFVGVWDDHFVVVMDDVFDTGKSALLLADMLLRGHGIQDFNLRMSFLINKKRTLGHNFRVGGVSCRAALLTKNENDWLVGFGMDTDLHNRGDKEIWIKKI